MSVKIDYSAEEWKAISCAPVAAGLLITLADANGPVGLAKEAVAVGRAISESAASDAPEVVRAIADSAKREGRPDLPEIPMGDQAQTTGVLLGILKSAVAAVQAKSPAEAAGYKTWLKSVATRVAEASKEGGFLGFGGTVVSRNEDQALQELAAVLA